VVVVVHIEPIGTTAELRGISIAQLGRSQRLLDKDENKELCRIAVSSSLLRTMLHPAIPSGASPPPF
jgi:hypothetical protein